MALAATVVGYAGNGYTYVIQPTYEPAFGGIGNIVPCDRKAANTAGNKPFATLLNGPGEFSGAIGLSGSKKAPSSVPCGRATSTLKVTAVPSPTLWSDSSCIAVAPQLPVQVFMFRPLMLKPPIIRLVTKYLALSESASAHTFRPSEPWLGVASLI